MSYQPPLSGSDQDETLELRPKFNEDGLIAAIAQDYETGDVLMLAWMNADALTETLHTGRVTYWSRSRGALWRKGDTSGHTQELVELKVDCDQDAVLIAINLELDQFLGVAELKVDCDQDAVLMRVRQAGGACHTGRKSCFYRIAGKEGVLKFGDPDT